MESDIIVEGFKAAEKTHGLRYMFLVADGDSSVFARIREEIPVWGGEVQKIECANHMCKCLRNNLEKLVDNNPSYKGKNKLTKSVRIHIVSAVRCAIRMRSKEIDQGKAAVQLEKDIRNSIHHIFGNHERCSDFCKAKTKRIIENDLQANMLKDISVLLDRVASKSARLIHNTTTNLAECWMHMRSKFDGGKLYNLCNRGSWHTRCFGGCLRMNLGTHWSPTVWKKVTGSTPGHHFQKLYNEKDAHLSHSNKSKKKPEASMQRWKRKMSSDQGSKSKSARKSYGPEAIDVEPDISKKVLDSKMAAYLEQHINIPNEKIKAIELLTINQSHSKVWHEERKKRITASMFGSVIKRKPTIPVKKIVEQMLYKSFKGTALTRNGLQQERNTIHEYVLKKEEEGENVEVRSCGFIINENSKFLGGSPDGVVYINGIKSGLIEVKNVLYNKSVNLNEAAKQNKTFFLQFSGQQLNLKENHKYYYQCQGLLHITNLPWIDFVVRTMNPYQIHIERIYKDVSLWHSWLPKLKAFYNLALLPELSCPRHGKSPDIREPGIWFEVNHTKVLRKKKARKTTETSQLEDSCGSGCHVPTNSDQSNNRRKASHRTKFVGRRISHEWKVSKDSTEWFAGTVLSLVAGTDGSDDAVYEVLYDNDTEAYEVDHLVEDYKETSVKFLDL